MVLMSEELDWGISATTLVPACVFVIISFHLMSRKILTLNEDSLEIEIGWLWRRCHEIKLEQCSLELAPMAGLWVVVLRASKRVIPIATWVSKKRAELIMNFIDQVAPQGQWPRHAFERSEWDR